MFQVSHIFITVSYYIWNGGGGGEGTENNLQ